MSAIKKKATWIRSKNMNAKTLNQEVNPKLMIQVTTNTLADMCLEKEGPHDYNDKDLMNASLIFIHFLMDHIWQTNQDMTHEGREKVVHTTGLAIRELIQASTGKDMHELAKK